jgi:hypothetical protein
MLRLRPFPKRLWNSFRCYRDLGIGRWRSFLFAWRISRVSKPFLVDRDGRVYLPDRKVELKAR